MFCYPQVYMKAIHSLIFLRGKRIARPVVMDGAAGMWLQARRTTLPR